MADDNPWPGRKAFLLGLKDSLGLPAIGVCAALFGYGVMVHEAGLDVVLLLVSVLTIWAMPVLMGFVELVSAGSPPLLAFVTLLAIAFRNMPMSVSAIPMIRNGPAFRWHHLVMAQILSPTAWVQITVVGRKISAPSRMPYYTAFSLSLLLSSLFGAWAGFTFTGGLPPALGIALLLLTPLFVIMTMATSPKLSSRMALVLGCIGVPVLMQWDSEWGLVVGGFAFGTAGYALSRLVEKRGKVQS